MEICVECSGGEKYTVEVGVDDTITDIRRKAAAAAALCEDGFDMSFGGKVITAGDSTTQLSAGDTVVLTKKTKSQKDDAIAALRNLGWEAGLTAESLVSLTDPKLVHLFLQAEVVTEIPDNVLSGGSFKELNLSGASAVTKVGANFLSKCYSLTTIDISGWSNVTHIGSCFLQRYGNCWRVSRLDISGWNNVTHIGSDFLKSSKVSTLDLSRWTKVVEIEHSFLHDCRMLTSLDLSGWRNVTRIGDSFLCDCERLNTLDISGWNKVTVIKSEFLCNCISLTTLDMSGWSNVTHVEQDFLAHCTSLSTLNLSGWSSVTQIVRAFQGCKIPTSSINVTGSSSVVSKYVSRGRYRKDTTTTEHETKDTPMCRCVCM